MLEKNRKTEMRAGKKGVNNLTINDDKIETRRREYVVGRKRLKGGERQQNKIKRGSTQQRG